MKAKFLTSIKNIKREQWLIGIILGALLLVIATPVKKKENNADTSVMQKTEIILQTDNLAQIYEKQLEETLALVAGVGNVKAAVTIESSSSKIVEKDIPTSSEKSTQIDETGSENTSEYTNSGESTVYEETEDGAQIPYVVSEIYPQIRGVIVVAQGGDDPVIVKQIQEAVMALFHMDAHKIKVLKMK